MQNHALAIYSVIFTLLIAVEPCYSASAERLPSEPSLFDLSLKQLLTLQVVTAASGFEQHLSDAPAAVTIIQAEEWQARGARTLFEAISPVVGVHISKAQTAISNNKPIIRGVSGSFGQQILVLLDGVPFRRIRDGAPFLGQRIPLAGIKRIEVIRSPGSVVYGADAMGGIINMVSFNADEQSSSVTLRMGSYGSYNLAVNHAAAIGSGTLQVAGELQNSDGDPHQIVEHDLQTMLDAMFNTALSNAPGPINDDYKILNLHGRWQQSWFSATANLWQNFGSGAGVGIAQALDPEGWVKQRAEHYQMTADLSDWVAGTMSLNTTYRRVLTDVWLTLFPPGTSLPVDADGNINFTDVDRNVTFVDGVIGTPGGDNRAQTVQLQHIYSPSSKHTLRWELGAEHIEVHATESKNFGAGVLPADVTSVDGTLVDVTNTPAVYLPDKSRNLHYLSLQDQWQIHSKWIATLGLRYDYYSDFGATWNPRLGLVWHRDDRLTFKLFGGTAFRAPSFVDLYTQNNPTGQGNPNLQPEEIKTFDFGLVATYTPTPKIQWNLNTFHYSASNMIRFEPQGGVQIASNGGKQTGSGMELQFSWRPSEQLTLNCNYYHLDPQINTRTNISSSPENLANIGLYYRPQPLRWYLGAKWVADRQRQPSDPRPTIDDYWWVTARVEMDAKQWQMGLSVNNLLNADAREPSNGFIRNDYPLSGRQWMVDIKYRFNK